MHQHVLLKFVEDTYKTLDNGEITAVILTDLSKAFDALPYRLLLAKLKAYGFTTDACKLLANYFTYRMQRVKLGSVRSGWLPVIKGAPQGSLLGPFAYNTHSNDLLLEMSEMCSIYNYADDNTIAVHGQSHPVVIEQLSVCANYMIDWFTRNCMKANPDKFQFIVFDRSINQRRKITIHGTHIDSQDTVKLLGVKLDQHLTFDEHIKDICLKAGRKLSVLSRMSNVLDMDAKLQLTNAFIMSQFEYCACIWHFCSRSNSRKIEKIQQRALRHIYNDYTSTYAVLRDKATIPLMYVKRLRKILLELHKIVSENCPTYLHGMVARRDCVQNTRNNGLPLPRWQTSKYGQNTFSYQAVKLWNILGSDKNHESIQSFKTFLKQWSGPKCLCSYCNLCVLNQL